MKTTIDLNTTKAAILKWVASCETDQQLDLILEIIIRFVVERFSNTENVVDELTTAVAAKKADLIVRT